MSNNVRICANCGHKNRRHHAFCRSCGVRLQTAGEGSEEESAGVSDEGPKGARDGRRLWLLVAGVLFIVGPILALAVVFSVRVVGDGEVGVVYVFGEADPDPRPPRLHFKLP